MFIYIKQERQGIHPLSKQYMSKTIILLHYYEALSKLYSTNNCQAVSRSSSGGDVSHDLTLLVERHVYDNTLYWPLHMHEFQSKIYV